MAGKKVADAALGEVREAGNAWRHELSSLNRERLHAAMADAMEHGFTPHAVAEAASDGNSRFTPIKVRQIAEDWKARRRTA